MSTTTSSDISTGDFAEFMWMENQEDFDREVQIRLVEEDAISLEWHSMLDEEDAFFEQMDEVRNDELSSSTDSSDSDLNPHADAFVPMRMD